MPVLLALLLSIGLAFGVDGAAAAARPAPAAPPVPSAVTLGQESVLIGPEEVDSMADYRISVDLANAEIDVEVVIDVTFNKPSEQVGNVIYDYYLTEWFTVLPSSAADVEAFDNSGALNFDLNDAETPGIKLATIDLRQNLFNGGSTEVTVSYSMPSDPPPVDLQETATVALEDQVVVNEAAAGWAFFSDPGLDSWDVEVVVPGGFAPSEALAQSGYWDQVTSASGPTLTAAGDEFFYQYLVVENDAAMLEEVIQVDGHPITIRYWPGASIWKTRVIDQITDQLPVLIDLIGQPWPDRDLIVQQSAETLGTSYGGWYTTDDHRITIGPSVNAELILHEFSHVWFNYRSLQDRWLIEGLANEFAVLSVDGPNGANEPDVSVSDPSAIALREWRLPTPFTDESGQSADVERWGYDGSWFVVRRTREVIGVEAVTEITRSILGGARSYPGPGAQSAERVNIDAVGAAGSPEAMEPGWQEFLDLAADHDPGNELAPVFADWVEGEWSERFEQRADARRRYGPISDRAGDWTMPETVRRPMRNWDFGVANEAMDETAAFLDAVDGHQETLSQVGLELPADTGRRLAEASTNADLVAYRGELGVATNRLVGFEKRADQLGLIERLGLLGSSFDSVRDQARGNFAAGELDLAAGSLADGNRLADQASSAGQRRLALAVVGVLFPFGLWWSRARRRRGGPRGEPGPAVPTSDDGFEVGTAHGASSEEITMSQRSRQSLQR